MQHAHRHLRRIHPRAIPLSVTVEGWVFVVAIAATIYFMQSGAFSAVVAHGTEWGLLSVFVSGMFYTSIVTAVPATYALIQSAEVIPAWQMALMGGLGSVLGDIIMFRLVRSRLSDQLLSVMLHPRTRKIGRFLSTGPLWWTAPVFGALAFATPLPDEIGIVMMGVSHLKFSQLALFAFVTHAIGIFAIAVAVQQLTG